MSKCSHIKLNKPAHRWLDAFPLGNGRIGAMDFGGTIHERIGLNHENLWRGKLKSPKIPRVAEQLPKIRNAFLNGDIALGTDLANCYLGGPEGKGDALAHVQPYQPFGDLLIHLESTNVIDEYQRDLDLQNGVSVTSFVLGENSITRTVFVSSNLNCIVLKMTSSHSLSGTIVLERIIDVDATINRFSKLDRCGFNAFFSEGINFSAHARLITDGKIVSDGTGSLRFVNSHEVIVYVSLSTDYHGADPVKECSDILLKVPHDFEAVCNSHILEHRSYYDRVVFELGDDINYLPVDKRVSLLRKGGNDPGLFALYFNYARYLLISSSRNCDQPANLQGIWNENIRPPWASDFHANINLQMNYWHAELCALPECSDVLFSFLERHRQGCREAAKNYFGARGLFYTTGDIWKMNWMSGKGWDVWTGGAAWLAAHFWSRWQYSCDKIFLQERAYPFIKEVAEFYEDFLVEDNLMQLVTIPSQSPENRFIGGAEPISLCIGATLDYLLITELLGNAISASTILNIDETSRIKWQAILGRIPEFNVGKYGQLQEWQIDYDEMEPGHRHISHLYGIYPGNLMTPTKRIRFFNAARVSLERRLSAGGGHTGWSRAWACCWWARFSEGTLAYEHLSHLLTDYNTDSLLDTHPLPGGDVFQIDGNFGGAAAIAELLIQFHDDYVNILPCLPAAWPSGNVKGLRIWGGFEVSLKWDMGILQCAQIRAHTQENLYLKLPRGEWRAQCGEKNFCLTGKKTTSITIPCKEVLTVTPFY